MHCGHHSSGEGIGDHQGDAGAMRAYVVGDVSLKLSIDLALGRGGYPEVPEVHKPSVRAFKGGKTQRDVLKKTNELFVRGAPRKLLKVEMRDNGCEGKARRRWLWWFNHGSPPGARADQRTATTGSLWTT